MPSKLVARSCQSWKSGADTWPRTPVSRQNVDSVTSRSWSAYGSGRSSTASTTLKIAVFAPMPSARTKRRNQREGGLLQEQPGGIPQVGKHSGA